MYRGKDTCIETETERGTEPQLREPRDSARPKQSQSQRKGVGCVPLGLERGVGVRGGRTSPQWRSTGHLPSCAASRPR